MGLDIQKYRVVKHSDKPLENGHTFTLLVDNTNRNKQSFFQHFADYAYTVHTDYIDIGPWFESKGLRFEDYRFCSTRFCNHRQDTAFDYELIADPSVTITAYQIELPEIVVEETAIDVEKVPGYQRKQMSTEFYSDYLQGCWYVADASGDEDDGIIFAYTQELLDRAKAYADPDAPIHQWQLAANEFVEFNA
jgi:hypothetical protein